MKIRNQALSLLILLFSVSFIPAQRPAKGYLFEVRGKVVDTEKAPYGAMHLKFEKEGFNDSALSDENGVFSVKLPPGHYKISTSEVNSATFSAFIEISENGLNPTDFELIVESNKDWCANCPPGKSPEVVKYIASPYPPTARAVGVAGEVVVEIKIDPEGKVVSAKAIGGHPLLRRAGVTAAEQWVFTSDKTIQEREGKLIFTFYDTAGKNLLVRYRAPNRLEILSPAPVINYNLVYVFIFFLPALAFAQPKLVPHKIALKRRPEF